MSEKLNIHENVSGICSQLGIEPALVRRLDVTPTSVTAEVYKRNEQGSKYVDEDGEAAVEHFQFDVVT
jgi:hypothetical protein